MIKCKKTQYKNKNIIILGLGITGLSCVKYFLKKGITPIVVDNNYIPKYLNELPKNVKLHIGKLNKTLLKNTKLIIISPGIKITELESQEILKNNIEIISDIELFCRETNKPIIAITGTNGKSTVTSLVGEIIKSAKISVGIGGNIGIPALSLLNLGYDIYVLELSSFQLERTYSLKAFSATILNVCEDHMDRYSLNFKKYYKTKLKIYNNAKNCIINIQDFLTFPKKRLIKECISFGLDNGNYLFDTKQCVLKVNNKTVLDVNEMNIIGQHNYLNALSALALADTINIPRNISLQTLKKYSGLKHRFQLVLFNKGVYWINDSKSTNVASTEAALKSLKTSGNVYLLLGGDGKSADFSPLKKYINDNFQIYCFGYDRKKLSKISPNKSIITKTMNESLYLLSLKLKKGDTVLLSPACSSLDQFKNFEHRGDVFTKLAKRLG
ncbi:UDP-N-acetylmuramoyl-L-alanine--D-glutamate ligase [Candidatus Providencia siddallii]|uniref:UDP-N-acetylmuramoylalanine--D-glutamate ligase n=1 Tax=Candidatus Providencia siddallii TaxID=1715285 RepID=A0ABM9NP23_9GAMM